MLSKRGFAVCRPPYGAGGSYRKRSLRMVSPKAVLEFNLPKNLETKLQKFVEEKSVGSKPVINFPFSIVGTRENSARDFLLGYDFQLDRSFSDDFPEFLQADLGFDEKLTSEYDQSFPFVHVKGQSVGARQRRLARKQSRPSSITKDFRSDSLGTSENTKEGRLHHSFAKDNSLSFRKCSVDSQLLTREQELYLCKTLRASYILESKRKILQRKCGKRLNDLELANHVSIPVAKLSAILSKGAEAREKLVSSNIRLVISLAKQFSGRGLPLEDLVQFGMHGLMRGIDKFDPNRGYKLSTYVHWWIRQAINRAVANHARTVRIPVHVQECLLKIHRARHIIGSQKPENIIKELAEHIGVSESKIEKTLKARMRTHSMDSEVRNSRAKTYDKAGSYHQFVADPDAVEDLDSLQREFILKEFRRILNKLSPRELAIIKAHYGIGEPLVPASLEEVSKRHGISRERTRQIENIAMQRLKSVCEDENFKNVLLSRI